MAPPFCLLARRLACLLIGLSFQAAARSLPEAVQFPSADGKTLLTGYFYQPAVAGPWPAVVMMHGRSGAYSSAAKGRYDAQRISQRHRQWGEFWAARGYAALLVDSFGPRGHAGGFPRGSYASRPAEINEQSIRPLDAYGALDWLRARPDIAGGRIGLQGWSNGAMATLATMAEKPLAFLAPVGGHATPANGFRAALAFYPGCTIQAKSEWRPYAPLVMLVASRDEEVSPVTCRRLAEAVNKRGAAGFEFVWYEGAQHAFDDPGKARQAVPANRAATEDSMQRAAVFFARELNQGP
jgi:carboxymethylenebutenolidase